jgi:hypothetical protein
MNIKENDITQTVAAMSGRALETVESRSKALAKAANALKKLADPKTPDTPKEAKAALEALAKLDLRALGIDCNLDALREVLRAELAERGEERRFSFVRALTERARSCGISSALLTTDPLELALPPFTLRADLAENKVEIRYARLPLATLKADPEVILDAHEKHLKQMESGWAPEQFFDALAEAYRIERIRKQLKREERVMLCDIVGLVAWMFQGRQFQGDPVAGHYHSYGRARFAFDLARLRRAGLLERDGRRINLGAATGASTKDKRRVLYIEDNAADGQYYATLWITTAGDEET